MADEISTDLPFWAKALLFAVGLLPIPGISGILQIVKAVLPLVIAIIAKIPHGERQSAIDELLGASARSTLSGDVSHLANVVKKHCDGVGCQADLAG